MFVLDLMQMFLLIGVVFILGAISPFILIIYVVWRAKIQ
jgi:hypothetical protein